MGYTREQIGEVERGSVSSKTKERLGLVLIQHGQEHGRDETQIVIAAPLSWQRGRRRSLELIAAGVDPDDIRVFQVASPFEKPAAVGDAGALHSLYWPLWWTAADDALLTASGLMKPAYAAAVLAIGERGLADQVNRNGRRQG
ncbi:MAG TPA: hypothetical protein VGC15_15490 [Acetobacteraceae bacterium]